MLGTQNPLSIRLSPLHHAWVCFFLAMVLFLLAAGSVYWNESSHYHIYLGLGLVFAMLGIVPLVMHLLQGRNHK